MEGTRLVGPSKFEVGLTAHTSCGDEWSLQPPGCSSQFASKEQLCTNGKGIWVTREFYLVTRYLEERELPRGLEGPGVMMIHPETKVRVERLVASFLHWSFWGACC